MIVMERLERVEIFNIQLQDHGTRYNSHRNYIPISGARNSCNILITCSFVYGVGHQPEGVTHNHLDGS